MNDSRRAGRRIRAFIRGLSPEAALIAVWATGLGAALAPSIYWLAPSAALWLSAAWLARVSPSGRMLFRAAALFLLTWTALICLLRFREPGFYLSPIKLSVWLALGLDFMLAVSPVRLAERGRRWLAPVIGRRRAHKSALALLLLMRLLPQFLEAALSIRRTLNRRAANLPFSQRLRLWAGALARQAAARNEDLARVLIKRMSDL